MGITVISAPAASAPCTNTPSTPSTVDGSTTNFAALLTSQIAGPQMANNVLSASPAREDKGDADKDGDLIRDILAAQDPRQAAQNAIPNIAPAIENRPRIDVDRNSPNSANQHSDVPLGELGNEAKMPGDSIQVAQNQIEGLLVSPPLH